MDIQHESSNNNHNNHEKNDDVKYYDKSFDLFHDNEVESEIVDTEKDMSGVAAKLDMLMKMNNNKENEKEKIKLPGGILKLQICDKINIPSSSTKSSQKGNTKNTVSSPTVQQRKRGVVDLKEVIIYW